MMLTEKLVLVTGASRGIGQAIALTLGNAGATVVGTATSQKGAKAITKQFSEQKIQNVLQSLPDHFRSPVILRDIQELSYEDISKILDVPLGTVKSRINRARQQLKSKLKE